MHVFFPTKPTSSCACRRSWTPTLCRRVSRTSWKCRSWLIAKSWPWWVASAAACSTRYGRWSRATGRRERSASPSGVRKNDAIAVRVFEGETVAIPIGIERRHRFEARQPQALDGLVPFLLVRQIEDQQVVPGGRPPGRMAALAGELQVIGRARPAEHDAIEAVMVREPVEH